MNFATATDSYNTAVGDQAGLRVTTGVENTLIGGLAGDAITDADGNVAVGYNALGTNTVGSRAVAIGHAALLNQNPGTATNTFNIAIGYSAGASITSGTYNTIVGGEAGDAITVSNNNSLFGYLAGGAIISGSGNSFVGQGAGAGTVSGSDNVAIGRVALSGNCGNDNTALGSETLNGCTGSYNTSAGYAAGYAVTSGSNNLFLGRDAGRTGSPGGNYTSESHNIVLGDENITEAHIQVDWSVASDQRDKTDFTALDLGLDFVKALAPVTYKWDKRSKYGDKTANDYDLLDQTPDGTHKEDWLDVGFKAQEVQALEEAAGYTTAAKKNLTVSTSGDGKQMGIQYSKFVPILVKAIQEQNALIEALTARIATLEG
jgi:hypothetical protein